MAHRVAKNGTWLKQLSTGWHLFYFIEVWYQRKWQYPNLEGLTGSKISNWFPCLALVPNQTILPYSKYPEWAFKTINLIKSLPNINNNSALLNQVTYPLALQSHAQSTRIFSIIIIPLLHLFGSVTSSLDYPAPSGPSLYYISYFLESLPWHSCFELLNFELVPWKYSLPQINLFASLFIFFTRLETLCIEGFDS